MLHSSQCLKEQSGERGEPSPEEATHTDMPSGQRSRTGGGSQHRQGEKVEEAAPMVGGRVHFIEQIR